VEAASTFSHLVLFAVAATVAFVPASASLAPISWSPPTGTLRKRVTDNPSSYPSLVPVVLVA
jgi:hypothetical protein